MFSQANKSILCEAISETTFKATSTYKFVKSADCQDCVYYGKSKSFQKISSLFRVCETSRQHVNPI